MAEFAHNNREHLAIKMSSFYVNSGFHPVDFSNVQTSLSNLSAEEFARHIKEVYSLAKVNLTQVAEDMK